MTVNVTVSTLDGISVAVNPQLSSDIAGKIPLAQKGIANGVATLGADSKIPGSQLPSLAIGETFTVASQAAMLALVAQRGDVAVRTDLDPDGFFLLTADTPTVLGSWVQITAPGGVTSVDGQVGAVALNATYVRFIAPTGVAAIDTAAISSALAAGGKYRLAAGTFEMNAGLLWPNAAGSVAVQFHGAGRGTTILQWSTDLGEGTYAMSIANINGPGVAHSLKDLTIRGPGVNNGLGVAPCNMHGIRPINQFFCQNVTVSRFNRGIVRIGDHQVYDVVESTENLYGVYADNFPSAGDVVWRNCLLVGNKLAGVGVHGSYQMAGDRFEGTHFGFSPYGIWGESGTAFLMVDCMLVGSGFESCGNGFISAGTASRSIDGVHAINCPATFDTNFKLATAGANAAIETGGAVSNCHFSGKGCFSSPGTVSYLSASNVNYCTWDDGQALVDNVRASTKPFHVGSAALNNEVRTGSARYVMALAADAIVQDTLVGSHAFGYVRAFANQSFTPLLGVAGTGAAAGNGVLVAIEGVVPVLVGPTAAVVDGSQVLLTFDPAAVAKVTPGTRTSPSIVGAAASGAAANGTASVRVQVQF